MTKHDEFDTRQLMEMMAQSDPLDVDEAWTVAPGTEHFALTRGVPTQIERLKIVGSEGGWELLDVYLLREGGAERQSVLRHGPILVRGAGGQVKIPTSIAIDRYHQLGIVVRNLGPGDQHLVVSTRSRALVG